MPRVSSVESTEYTGYLGYFPPNIPAAAPEVLRTITEYFGYPAIRLSKVPSGYLGYPPPEVPHGVSEVLGMSTEYLGYQLPKILSILGYPGHHDFKILGIMESIPSAGEQSALVSFHPSFVPYGVLNLDACMNRGKLPGYIPAPNIGKKDW